MSEETALKIWKSFLGPFPRFPIDVLEDAEAESQICFGPRDVNEEQRSCEKNILDDLESITALSFHRTVIGIRWQLFHSK